MQENIEVYEEDGIIYTVISESVETQLNRLFDERYRLDDLKRYNFISEKNLMREKTPYIFITINPNPHILLQEFIGIMNKMMSKPWIENYLYVYEQRGEDEGESGKGFHFHAIIEKPTNKSYAHILREMSSSANKVCDSSVSNFFNIKNISKEEKERKIIYLTGRKADVSKHLKQDIDIIFRTNNNLKSFYNVGVI